MPDTVERDAYRFIPGPFQYSAGVAAKPGFALHRIRFAKPVPLIEGFRRIEAFMISEGLPLTAFAACELRSPAPFTDAGFVAFNREYVGTLERWGIFRNEENPVARSNVCPELHYPDGPSFHAFSLAVPAPDAAAPDAAASFVIAGSAESQEGAGAYRDRTVRYGATSADGMRDKIAHVITTMERRLAAVGAGWADTTATQVYTVFDIHPILPTASWRAARHGTGWIGTSADRRWSGWITKWTAAACTRSGCCRPKAPNTPPALAGRRPARRTIR